MTQGKSTITFVLVVFLMTYVFYGRNFSRIIISLRLSLPFTFTLVKILAGACQNGATCETTLWRWAPIIASKYETRVSEIYLEMFSERRIFLDIFSMFSGEFFEILPEIFHLLRHFLQVCLRQLVSLILEPLGGPFVLLNGPYSGSSTPHRGHEKFSRCFIFVFSMMIRQIGSF